MQLDIGIFLLRMRMSFLRRFREYFGRKNDIRREVLMTLPDNLKSVPEIQCPDQYQLRQYKKSDFVSYQRLMFAADMGYSPLSYWDNKILPEGFFVIEHKISQVIVAACFASEVRFADHGVVGNLGWLASHPDHRGHGLGMLVASKVTQRLIDNGRAFNYLGTQSDRLSAIKLYLRLGWISYESSDEEKQIWLKIRSELA